MKQNIVIKYTGKFESHAVPKSSKCIKASALVPKTKSKLLNSAAALFVECDSKVYLVGKDELVPQGTKLVCNSAQEICGIPAVAGG